MEGTETVTSSADLMASVPSDMFTAPDVTEVAAEAPEAEVPEAIETEEATPEAIEEPATEEAEEEPEETEETPQETAPEETAEAAEELPEGVRRGKDRNGKEGLWLTPQRYEQFHGAHKAIRGFEELIGEPLTPDALDLRNRAYMGQERLYSDLLSGDPQAQANVLNHFFDEAQRAQEEGEIGTDPMAALGETLYNTIREKSPEGYAKLRFQAARDLVSEMYAEAAKSGNRNLWLSMGHVAKTLGIPFHKADEMESFVANQSDPVAMLQAKVQSLESQLNGRQTTNQAAQFDQWHNTTRQATTQAVTSEAITPALAEAQKAWEKFPDAFKDLVVDRLHSRVRETLQADKGFNERIAMLTKAAQRAPSAQKRAEFAEQIKQAHVQRARLAVDAHKSKILSDAARLFKERSDANHARRSAAQSQRSPSGQSSPVPRSIIPGNLASKEGANFNPKDAVSDLARLFS